MSLEALSSLSCGLFSVLKHKNITSAKLLEEVKEILFKTLPSSKKLKFGHGGTLDHTATGVLVIGSGAGCKVLQKLIHGSKTYTVTGILGLETDSYNETGNVVNELPFGFVDLSLLKKHLQRFEGNIMQVPPKYSALKKHGYRVSDLVRCGLDVQMEARPVKCYRVDCLSLNPPYFTLRVECGGGFYVRSLVHDLAKSMGTCAHVVELHRNKQGPFSETEALSKEDWNLENIVSAIRKSKQQHSELWSRGRNIDRHKQRSNWTWR